jgi:hypothetical protein
MCADWFFMNMETFILRIYRILLDETDNVSGILEHVPTGRKCRFKNLEELNSIILESEHKMPEEDSF